MLHKSLVKNIFAYCKNSSQSWNKKVGKFYPSFSKTQMKKGFFFLNAFGWCLVGLWMEWMDWWLAEVLKPSFPVTLLKDQWVIHLEYNNRLSTWEDSAWNRVKGITPERKKTFEWHEKGRNIFKQTAIISLITAECSVLKTWTQEADHVDSNISYAASQLWDLRQVAWLL